MDSGSVTCLSTVMILFSALIMHFTRRTVEKRLQEQQMRARIARQQEADKRHDAMLVVLKWVHQVHQAVYFAEVSAQQVLAEKPDDSGWEDVASRLDAVAPCPSATGLLPESLSSMVSWIDPQLAEIKGCVARHRESLSLILYAGPSALRLSEAELGAARKALAEDLQEKSRKLNLFMEALEKHFDAAFFGTSNIRLHRGRNDAPVLSRSSSTSKEAEDQEG